MKVLELLAQTRRLPLSTPAAKSSTHTNHTPEDYSVLHLQDGQWYLRLIHLFILLPPFLQFHPFQNGPSTAYVKPSQTTDCISPADHQKLNSTIYSLTPITAPASQQTSQLEKRRPSPLPFLFLPRLGVPNAIIYSTLIERPRQSTEGKKLQLHILPRPPAFPPGQQQRPQKDSSAVPLALTNSHMQATPLPRQDPSIPTFSSVITSASPPLFNSFLDNPCATSYNNPCVTFFSPPTQRADRSSRLPSLATPPLSFNANSSHPLLLPFVPQISPNIPTSIFLSLDRFPLLFRIFPLT